MKSNEYDLWCVIGQNTSRDVQSNIKGTADNLIFILRKLGKLIYNQSKWDERLTYLQAETDLVQQIGDISYQRNFWISEAKAQADFRQVTLNYVS